MSSSLTSVNNNNDNSLAPIQCQICANSKGTQVPPEDQLIAGTDLFNHIGGHFNYHPHICHQCDYATIDQNELIRHGQQTHHAIQFYGAQNSFLEKICAFAVDECRNAQNVANANTPCSSIRGEMVSASEAIEDYRKVLEDLTRNDKTHINLLTSMAEDYALYSTDIVTVIDDTIHKCPAPQKIILLYVVDSVIKNTKQENGAYRDLFARKIVDMVVHVFKESDERTRASLYRLRCAWANVFPKSQLRMMDTKINAIAKEWPIFH